MYDEVDDHEEVHNVHILPARPIEDEREYAGRQKSIDTFSLPVLSVLVFRRALV